MITVTDLVQWDPLFCSVFSCVCCYKQQCNSHHDVTSASCVSRQRTSRGIMVELLGVCVCVSWTSLMPPRGFPKWQNWLHVLPAMSPWQHDCRCVRLGADASRTGVDLQPFLKNSSFLPPYQDPQILCAVCVCRFIMVFMFLFVCGSLISSKTEYHFMCSFGNFDFPYWVFFLPFCNILCQFRERLPRCLFICIAIFTPICILLCVFCQIEILNSNVIKHMSLYFISCTIHAFFRKFLPTWI